ncbi:MAG: hypothetical protein M3041_15945 [Acidobacteriota bacterium]|nr:hypothetical protein [Acidobacteriota bacterium]
MPKMNLYLVLALALGAATPAPVASPAMTIVATRRVSSQQAVPFAVRRLPFADANANGKRLTADGQRSVDAPLTGACSPRAPAQA